MIKTNGIKFLAITAVLVTMAGQSHAAQINGLINFNGTVELNTGSAGTANRVTVWHGPNGNPNVAGATGDFAGFVTPGTTTAAFVAPWFFSSAAVLSFSTIDGFTFNLTESHITFQTGTAVTVSGTGIITGNGYDPTPGVWTFTTQNPAAASRFSFSASIRAVPCTGTIGDFVWQDLNSNGIQDSGEPGIDGVTVELRDGSDMLLRTTVTALNGFYQFAGLCAGTYKVRIDNAQPALSGNGPTQTSPPGAGDSTNDSNPNPYTVVLATNNSSDQTVDFGYSALPLGRIGDYVWKDTNQNGIQDMGENGIPGVTIRLKDNANNVLMTTVTDGSGGYIFSGLFAGTYKVEVVTATLPPGLMPTIDNVGPDRSVDSNINDSPVTLMTNSSEDLTIDFGYIPTPSGSIGDFVWNDLDGDGIQGGGEPGIAGVTVNLFDAGHMLLDSRVTDAVGYYLFSGLSAGTYTVEAPSSLNLGGFLYNPTTPEAPGSTFANDSNVNPASVTLLHNDDSDTTIDFGYTAAPQGKIGDFVWNDLNHNGIQDMGEPGINGVTVKLLDQTNMVIATQVTAGNGGYLFSGLSGGSYKVAVDPSSPALAGFTATTTGAGTNSTDSNPSPSMVVLASNISSDLTIDFGFYVPALGKIGDFVWKDSNGNGIQDSGEPGINGVTVRLYGAGNTLIDTVVTAGGGAYLFSGLAAGTYSVVVDTTSPALAGLVATTSNAAGSTTSNDSNGSPASVTLPTNSSVNLTIDFGYKMATPPGPLTTYTMGGWGSKPSGNNPGKFLADHFAQVYPAGLTVGGGFTLKFTSAKGIENFLPSGGTPARLSQSYVNPTTKLGVLAGQVVALRLGVDFSNAGITASGLASAKFKSGKFAGQTVGQVLALAEAVLGGAPLPAGISYSDLSDACTLVNENYDEGHNGGQLLP